VSTGAQVAVLDARGVRRTRDRSDLVPEERTRVRLIAFCGLALYGALRWSTLLSPAAVMRLLGMLAVASLVAAAGPALRARSRTLAVATAVIAIIAIFPLAGIPLSWVRHVRIAVTANAIGEGLSALPRATVPYTGINEWVRLVNLLGAGVLMIDAALMLAFAPKPVGELRRAAAALPLIVLAIVPSTLARPSLAYLHGLILFALLALFIWGERVPRFDAPLAVGVAALAGAAGMIAAPALDRHTPWLDYNALTGTLSPGHVETFDWTQRYGPLNWPRTGREVFDVKAGRPDYWKTQDLDLFNGTGWTEGYVQQSSLTPPPPAPAAVTKWTQTITVTLRAMRTPDVIAAGSAAAPDHIGGSFVRGYGDGTWTSGTDLQPGDSYSVRTYSPSPTAAQLGADSTAAPLELLAGYRTMLLPPTQGSVSPPPTITFPPFHSNLPIQSIAGIYGSDGGALMRSSAYGPAYALARRLARRSATQYAFVENVLHYLGHGYLYSETPPPARYPLLSFLFGDKRGYCQQFAGSMALLLRMGGVPARVATGFTTGVLDSATHQYVVTDIDAHAWVEVWFPRYGWVRFDPTPGTAPARGGHVPLQPIHGALPASTKPAPINRKPEPAPVTTPVKSTRHGGGAPGWLIPIVIAIPGLLVLLVLASTVRLREPRPDELLAELERALARTGRPVSGGTTLASLEHRYRESPEAARYIRTLRMLRFGATGGLPTKVQRRALRSELRRGLGVLGRLRALWALPPRWTPAWTPGPRGLHSD
jgi:protein-glutamine gamma-glutamyltransferase